MKKAPRKRRSAKDLDVIHIGKLPKWDDIDSPDHPEFMNRVKMALRHYGYFFNIKDFYKDVVKWAENNINNSEIINNYKKAPEWKTPMTVCSLVAAEKAGMPMKKEHADYIIGHLTKIATEFASNEQIQSEKDKKQAKKVPEKTIQQRMQEKAQQHILYIEETYEDGIIERKEAHPNPNILEYLRKEDVPALTVNFIIDHFQHQLDEISSATGKNADPELKEGYSNLKRSDFKRFIDFYKALLNELNEYKTAKLAEKKVRKKKSQSKSKQVAKLKYLEKFPGLNLVSINPEEIIGAKVLWVYNVKTRKLGKYVAGEFDTLGVKGSTLTGIDQSKSVAKTLRKPKEQLGEFKRAGKVKLRKFMDSITTVGIKLTGRINKDTILLKVE